MKRGRWTWSRWQRRSAPELDGAQARMWALGKCFTTCGGGAGQGNKQCGEQLPGLGGDGEIRLSLRFQSDSGWGRDSGWHGVASASPNRGR